MAGPEFTSAIEATLANADRLADDAEHELEWDAVPTAYALAVIAQEEYAKALLLKLVDLGALPWSSDVQRALRDHRCKQLGALVLDYLCPKIDEFLRRHRLGGTWERLPHEIVDAIHLIVHERIPKETTRWWVSNEDRPLHRNATAVADGKTDQRKQNALYVAVGPDGRVTSTPTKITAAEATTQVERAKRMGSDLRIRDGVSRLPPHMDSGKLVDIFKLLTNQLSPEEFCLRWPEV